MSGALAAMAACSSRTYRTTLGNAFGIGYIKPGVTGAQGSVAPTTGSDGNGSFTDYKGATLLRAYSDIDRDFVITLNGTFAASFFFAVYVNRPGGGASSILKSSDAIITNPTLGSFSTTNWRWGTGAARPWQSADNGASTTFILTM